MRMKLLFPDKRLAPYVEAYFVALDSEPNEFKPRFPAVSTCYIKVSPVSAVVVGQTAQPPAAVIESDERVGLGVKLRAGAFHALFGLPAGELTSRVIRLDEVLGSAAVDLIGQMAGTGTPSARVECFERALIRFVQHRPGGSSIEPRAVAILRQFPAMPVAELAGQLGYSPRQLQRQFDAGVGLSPRLYRRIRRFERALELIEAAASAGKIDWPALAFVCGYSDQAHFIRDFREFMGCTPTLYLASLH